VVQLDQLRLGGTAINHTGRATRDAQTAARTRTLLRALKSDEIHVQLLKEAHRDQCGSDPEKSLRRMCLQQAHFCPI
jgi:hypothetical protein